jgi:transposase
MPYSIKDFKRDFPDDKEFLSYIFQRKYPHLIGKYYPVSGRKSYADSSGNQIYPLKGTIFQKSATPLTLWLYAIFLFASSKNGVSAKELQRQLGVTYKCAWRIAYQIRALMKQGDSKLTGIVEVDETYLGGKDKQKDKFRNKSALLGMVERKGRVKAEKIEGRETHILLNRIKKGVSLKSHIMTDEWRAYSKLPKMGYQRSSIKHGKGHYVQGNIYTNTIEGFWSQLKRSISGTYHSVSPKHLQSYVDEFAFRYNHRALPVFESLVGRI